MWEQRWDNRTCKHPINDQYHLLQSRRPDRISICIVQFKLNHFSSAQFSLVQLYKYWPWNGVIWVRLLLHSITQSRGQGEQEQKTEKWKFKCGLISWTTTRKRNDFGWNNASECNDEPHICWYCLNSNPKLKLDPHETGYWLLFS